MIFWLFFFEQMLFRPAHNADIPAILVLIEAAVRRLAGQGVDQWQDGYPNRACIEEDVATGAGYVIEEQGEVVAYGAVIFTGEEAYRTIDGAWLTEGTDYVVVHRVCVADAVVGQGFGRRFMEAAEALARNRVRSLRVDTRAENRVMGNLLPRLGFTRCGVIQIDGCDFIAYEKVL